MSGPTPARRVAYEVLRRVFEHEAYADRSLRSAAERFGLEGRERGLAQRLAYGAVQRRATTDYLIAKLADRRPRKIDPPLLAALRLGMFELLFDDGAAGYAAVDQAVELAKGGRDGGRRHRGAGLVNAVLRRATREGEGLLAALDERSPAEAAIRHSLPEWIAELWWEERGEEAALSLMRAANEPAARVYRPLTEGVAEQLTSDGVKFERVATPVLLEEELVRVLGGDWVAVERAVAEGRLIPQSLGSALAAACLGVEPGDRVLDLCAAPGIKTSQLAAAAGDGGKVVAVERDAGRAKELHELCERAGTANVSVLVGDGTELDLGSGYDRVLVDAPCTGLGTLASRPDARWRRAATDVPELAELQARLLRAGAKAVRPGGTVVYSVCTISRAESEDIVTELVDATDELSVADLSAGAPAYAADNSVFLQMLPGRDPTDGFFVARMEREA